MDFMLNRRMVFLALSFSLLLPASGCIRPQESAEPSDQRAICDYECQMGGLHSIASMENGSCMCRCERGYRQYNGTCFSEVEYDYIREAACNSECSASYPNSYGAIQNDTCACSCGKGYVSYNQSCITPGDFEKFAPSLCSEGYPVLKIYDWSYGGKGYYFYLCYRNETGSGAIEDRSGRHDLWNFVDDPYSNDTVSLVTGLLANISEREGFEGYEQAEFSIAFVQNLPYTYDNVTTPYDDYPRYPSETIYADGGDCEDTSILMAAILERMGYDVVLLRLPGHVAAGVSCNPSDFSPPAAAYLYDGREYCYLETTGEGYGIGQLPEDFGPMTNVTVVPPPEAQPDIYLGWGRNSTFNYTYAYGPHDMFVNVTGIRIDNFGPLTAKNVRIDASLESTGDGGILDRLTLDAGDIRTRWYYEGNFTNLRAPTGEPFRISVVVYGDNFEPLESKSGMFTWR
jgi:hypothetical protein